jgi:hypothetical protein
VQRTRKNSSSGRWSIHPFACISPFYRVNCNFTFTPNHLDAIADRREHNNYLTLIQPLICHLWILPSIQYTSGLCLVPLRISNMFCCWQLGTLTLPDVSTLEWKWHHQSIPPQCCTANPRNVTSFPISPKLLGYIDRRKMLIFRDRG